jgi:hypothetical protein
VRGSLQAVLVTVLVCVFSATIGATVGSSQTRSVAGTISLRAFAGETVITPKVASASTAPDGFPSFSRFAEQVQTLPNLSPKPGWPSPVDDREHRLFTLVDVLEYRPRVGSKETNDDYRWDIEGWYGGDYNRVWFKSEGQRDTAFKANYDVDFQLLYGRFIRKYYDFQIGGRVETQSFRGSNVTRGLAAIGIEGLVPYNYQIEPTLFIAQNGAVSARLSLTKDLLMTQRLILQLRLKRTPQSNESWNSRPAQDSTISSSAFDCAMKSDAGSRPTSDSRWIEVSATPPRSCDRRAETRARFDSRLECGCGSKPELCRGSGHEPARESSAMMLWMTAA